MLFQRKNSLVQDSTNYISDNLILLENVSVDYGNLQALDSVQVVVKKGEILFVTGPSGAGKTTLLKVMSGEQKPTKGSLSLPLKTVFTSQVFQDLRLNSKKSCEANLWASYDRSIHGSKSEFQRELSELCRYLGIFDRLGLKVRDANGGLKQKVALIRALLSRPDLILADEPTASLDKHNAMRVFETLEFYNKNRGLTVVWASHNKELVKQFSGKIVHLDKGRIIYSGHVCFI